MTARPLLGWLAEPAAVRGIRFFDRGGGWSFHSYRDLAGAVFATAARLSDGGVGRGDVVALALGSGPEFVAGFFGALAAGATPAPLAPLVVFQDPADYRRHVARVLATVRPRTVLTRPEWADRLQAALPANARPRLMVMTASELADQSATPQTVAAPAAHALLQFTSGSSGSPKAVAVSPGALEANIDAVRRWLRMEPDDATATWLPFHHDMGLVGCLLTPVVAGSDLWVMKPEDFVRTPSEWLRCFGTEGARLTALPTFGLAHVTRRVRAEAIEGLDFSQWRAVITGAERIDPDVLRRFVTLLEPQGFSPRALLPAYGLAEATLAVTGVALDAEPRTVLVDRRTISLGRQVALAPEGLDGTTTLVGCGAPLVRGGEVQITDRLGRRLPDGHVGEIVVGGPSVADGYVADDRVATAEVFTGSGVRTGDSGFLYEGELYVLGRLGDSLKRRARTVFAEDLEAAIADITALRHVRPVVLLGTVEGADTAVAVVEARPGPWAGEVARLLRRQIEDVLVTVVAGPRGIVRRTSSGKPRRRVMWDAFATGELGGVVVAPTALDGEAITDTR